MASQGFTAQIVSAGRSAVAMAAYRHRTRMFDETRGAFTKHYDKERDDLVHAEIALPENAPVWIAELTGTSSVERSSQNLWTYVQQNETRVDSQLARELLIALPIELSRDENIALVRAFVADHVVSKGLVVDWVYHDKQGNPHVHLMHTLRAVEAQGFGKKKIAVVGEDGTPLRVNNRIVYKTVVGDRDEYKALRLKWGEYLNEALARAGHDIRVDMRSYAERGIDLPSLSVTGSSMEMVQSGRASDEWLVKERARFAAADKLADDPSAVIKLVASQQSAFTEKDLAKAVHRYVDDPVQFQNIMSKVLVHPDISVVRGRIADPASGSVLTEPVYATREMIRTEYDMGISAERLAAAKGHGVASKTVNAAIRAVETKDVSRPFSFDREQVDAVHHVTRDNGIAAIVGFAGAGKSTLMEAANAAWVAEGRRVFGGALAGKAAEGLEGSAGISSRTLASWELSWKNDRDLLGKGDVFVIDEAGMVSSGQLARFVSVVEAAGAKLVLVGDAMQLQPIEAGAAFRAIADKIGYLELAGIRRQKDEWAQDASRSFARGNVAEALQAYHDRGHIKTEADKETIISRMVGDWMAARAEVAGKALTEARSIRGDELLVLAHSNADVLALNNGIRAALKETGALADERAFVSARGTRQFAVEDRIVFLENKAFTDPSAADLGKQRVKNGMLGTVIGIDQNSAGSDVLRVRLDNGREVAFSATTYNNIDHGYAATVHKSQGVTVDRAFVLASGGMDQHLTYVAMSRHRHQVDLYVPAAEFSPAVNRGMPGVFDALVASLSRSGAKSTTLDYADSADYRQIVDGYAARRGIDTLASIFPALTASIEKHRQNLIAGFERVASLWRGKDAAESVTLSVHAEEIRLPSALPNEVSPQVAPISGALLPMTAFATNPTEAAIIRIEQSAAWADKLNAMQPLINSIYHDPAGARMMLSRAAAIGLAGGENAHADNGPQPGVGFDPRALAQIVAHEPERFGNIRLGNPAVVQSAARDLAVHARALGISANQTRDKALASEVRHRDAAAHAIPELSEKTMRRLAEIEAVRVAGGKEAWSQAARYTIKDAKVITEVKALDAALTARFGWQAFSVKEDDKSRAVTQTRLSHADRIILSAPAISTFVTEATAANALGRVDEQFPAMGRASLTLEETWRAARQLASFNHFVEQRVAKQAVVAPEATQTSVDLPAQPATVAIPSVEAAPTVDVPPAVTGTPTVTTAGLVDMQANQPEPGIPVPAHVAEGVTGDEVRPIENKTGIRVEEPTQVAPTVSTGSVPGPTCEAVIVPEIAQRPEPLVPAVTLPNLNISEIRATVLQDPHVTDMGQRINRSAEIVYGDASVIQPFKAQALQSREQAVIAHDKIKADPEEIASLAGTPASFWRKASPERIEAERNVNDLAYNVEKYGLDFNRRIGQIQEEHRQEQNRQRVEIPAPSPRLAEMLSLKPDEQAAALSKMPELKTELSHLNETMRQRLTHVEHRALKEGNTQVVAKSLHINDEAAKRLGVVYSQVNQAQEVVRQQRRLEQSKGHGLSI